MVSCTWPGFANGKTRVFGFSEQPVAHQPRHPVAIPSSRPQPRHPARHPINPHPASRIPHRLELKSRHCLTLRDATRPRIQNRGFPVYAAQVSRAHLERIYFRPPSKKGTYCVRAPRSALASSCPVPITVHRASKSAGLLRCTSEIMPGSGVTASAIPFQSRQCSTLVPVLESHEMAANFSMHLADAVGTLACDFFAFVTSL